MVEPSSSMKRLEFLDSLRGLAALYVLVYHLAKMPPLETGLPRVTEMFVLFGGSGVILFFVISAFCLCLTMPRGDVSAAPVADFYTKRFFRIAPLFYAVVALTLGRNFLVHGFVPSAGDVLGNLTFAFNLIPGMQDSLVFAGWTIGVEMLFYLVFPALFILLRGIPIKLAACLVAGLAFPLLIMVLDRTAIAGLNSERYALLTAVRYLPAFIVGMVAFDLFNALQSYPAPRRLGTAVLGTGVLCFLGVMSGRLVEPVYMPVAWEAGAYALILLGLALFPVAVLVNRATQFLGKISYSVYLLHGPVILLINRPVYPRIYALPLPTVAKFGLCFAVTLVATLVVSTVAYRLVERPGIAVAQRLIAARRARSALVLQPS
jgi:peptidoglycan/LPS O-acetylase OafA/YrhL